MCWYVYYTDKNVDTLHVFVIQCPLSFDAYDELKLQVPFQGIVLLLL